MIKIYDFDSSKKDEFQYRKTNELNSVLNEVCTVFGNVMSNNVGLWQNVFANYMPSINSNKFSSFLSTFKNKIFNHFLIFIK